MDRKKISILIVDETYYGRRFLSEALLKDSAFEIVGTAADAYEARDKIMEFSPKVMLLSADLPRMNGIDFLRQLMPQYPLPVLVIGKPDQAADAMQAGAVDFLSNEGIKNESANDTFISELTVKLKIASIAKVGNHKQIAAASSVVKDTEESNFIIALGASTGGTEATSKILKEFKRDLPGIVIVQHMPPVFTRLYAERLNNTCAISVREAQDGDMVIPGQALLAPGDYQMQVVKNGGGYKVKIYHSEKVNGHCPSVDVLFSSVAKAAGANALGIILTGMGSDGAKGLLEMKEQGAQTIGQSKDTCVVYGMPMVAKEKGAVTHELDLDKIAKQAYKWFNGVCPRK